MHRNKMSKMKYMIIPKNSKMKRPYGKMYNIPPIPTPARSGLMVMRMTYDRRKNLQVKMKYNNRKDSAHNPTMEGAISPYFGVNIRLPTTVTIPARTYPMK
jgi:hypothetical protein